MGAKQLVSAWLTQTSAAEILFPTSQLSCIWEAYEEDVK